MSITQSDLDNANFQANKPANVAKLSEFILSLQSQIDSIDNSFATPTGTVADFAGTAAPSGWLLCYGQALDASTDMEYQALYDVIGNTYGGSDNTDFVVPDLRGRVIAGKDDMGGSSANRLTDQSGGLNGDTLGDTGGSETHTLTEAQMPSHTHTQNSHNHSTNPHNHSTQTSGDSGSTLSGSDNVYRFTDTGSPTLNTSSDSAGNTNSTTATNQNTGGGGAHNNVQPTIILNKIIKL